MTERLGNLLYWLGCGVAALFAVGGVWGYFNEVVPENKLSLMAIIWGMGLVAWLVGRGAKYLFAGK